MRLTTIGHLNMQRKSAPCTRSCTSRFSISWLKRTNIIRTLEVSMHTCLCHRMLSGKIWADSYCSISASSRRQSNVCKRWIEFNSYSKRLRKSPRKRCIGTLSPGNGSFRQTRTSFSRRSDSLASIIWRI